MDVEKNLTTAANLGIKSAEHGNYLAQFSLGFCYEESIGVEQKYTFAKEWYSKSAKNGNQLAEIKILKYFNNYHDFSIMKAKGLDKTTRIYLKGRRIYKLLNDNNLYKYFKDAQSYHYGRPATQHY